MIASLGPQQPGTAWSSLEADRPGGVVAGVCVKVAHQTESTELWEGYVPCWLTLALRLSLRTHWVGGGVTSQNAWPYQ